MNKFSPWATAAVVLMILTGVPAEAGAPAPAPPSPEEGSTVKAWVGEQISYDDNIYAIPSNSPVGTTISPDATRADFFNSASVGGLGQLYLGRKVFNVAARIDDNRFDHNDRLNNLAYDLSGLWNWSVGSPLYGTAGGELSKTLASFSQIRYSGKDEVKSSSYFATGRYQLGPHWALLGETSGLNANQSAAELSYNNFHGKLYTAGVEYSTEVDDTFAFRYNYYEGRYPDNYQIGTAFYNSDYNERFPQIFVKYGITDKTTFRGNIGHLNRQYVNATTGSYTGTVWRVYLEYHATDKVSLLAKSWHEVHAYNVSAADYFISTGGSISPDWAATEKFHVSLAISYDNQRYIPNSFSQNAENTNPGFRRNDRVLYQQLDLTYTPRDRWIINAFVHHEKRNSNLGGEFEGLFIYPFRYTYDLLSLAVTYKFF